MPMCFNLYESWVDDEGNPMPTRESRHAVSDRRRRYSIPNTTTTTTTKVHIVLPPTPEPEPQVQEICYIPRYVPVMAAPVVAAPDPFDEATFIQVSAEKIATRIVAENAARNEVAALQTRLEEEQALRIQVEHERSREEARRITQEVEADLRSRELSLREDDARRRIAEEYRFHSRSLGNSPRTSDEDLWSTSPRASSSHVGRLTVVDHHHHSSHHRSHSDSRAHRCSSCGHTGHRSRECRHSPEPVSRRISGRVRWIDSGL